MWWWLAAWALASGDDEARRYFAEAKQLEPAASLMRLDTALATQEVSGALEVEIQIWRAAQLAVLARFEQADAALDRAETLLAAGEGSRGLIPRVQMVRADLLDRQGRDAEALSTAQQAEVLFEEHAPDAPYRVNNLEMVNNLASQLGLADIAVRSGLQALALVEDQPKHPYRFEAWVAGAWALYMQNHTWDAVVVLETALADPDFDAQRSLIRHAVQGDLATFWTDLGDAERALAAGDAAIALAAEHPSVRELRATMAMNRAVLFRRLGDMPAALDHGLEALAHAQELRQQWEVLLLLSELTRVMGRHEAAARWLSRAEVAWMALDEDTARAVEPAQRLTEAHLAFTTGHYEQALAALRTAAAGPSTGSDLAIEATLVAVLIELDQHEEAAALAETAFAEALAQVAAGSRTADASRRRLLISRYQPNLHRWLATRDAEDDMGLVLEQVLAWRAVAQRHAVHESRAWRESDDAEVRATVAELAALRHTLAEATWNEPDQTLVHRLVARRKRLEAQLSAQLPVEAPAPTLEALCAQLSDTAALVVHAAYTSTLAPRDELAVFVLRGDDCSVSRAEVTAPDLAARLDRWVGALWSPTADPIYADHLGHGLRRELVDPVLPLLEGLDTLWLVPDGNLGRVSWAALPMADGSYLLEHYTLGYLDTLAPPEVRPGQTPALWVGAVPADASAPVSGTLADCAALKLSALPGTGAELDRLATDGTVLTGQQATEEAVEQVLSTGVRRLHLATHGFFVGARCGAPPTALNAVQDSPLTHSGLALAPGGGRDGIWTAEEVATLDLASTELVVLSACDAGLGEVLAGGSPQGLRAAFARAGVAQQVLGLWPVPDATTPALMQRFYRRLRRVPVTEALRDAQLQQLAANRRRYGHGLPGRWAAFVTVGWPPRLRPPSDTR